MLPQASLAEIAKHFPAFKPLLEIFNKYTSQVEQDPDKPLHKPSQKYKKAIDELPQTKTQEEKSIASPPADITLLVHTIVFCYEVGLCDSFADKENLFEEFAICLKKLGITLPSSNEEEDGISIPSNPSSLHLRFSTALYDRGQIFGYDHNIAPFGKKLADDKKLTNYLERQITWLLLGKIEDGKIFIAPSFEDSNYSYPLELFYRITEIAMEPKALAKGAKETFYLAINTAIAYGRREKGVNAALPWLVETIIFYREHHTHKTFVTLKEFLHKCQITLDKQGIITAVAGEFTKLTYTPPGRHMLQHKKGIEAIETAIVDRLSAGKLQVTAPSPLGIRSRAVLAASTARTTSKTEKENKAEMDQPKRAREFTAAWETIKNIVNTLPHSFSINNTPLKDPDITEFIQLGDLLHFEIVTQPADEVPSQAPPPATVRPKPS